MNTKFVTPLDEPVLETCNESTLLRLPSAATVSELNQKSVGSLSSRVQDSGTLVKTVGFSSILMLNAATAVASQVNILQRKDSQ